MKFSKILLLSILVVSSSQLFAAEGGSTRDLVRSGYGVDPDALDLSINYVMRLQGLNDAGNSTGDQFKSELNHLSAALFLDTFDSVRSEAGVEGAEMVWRAYNDLLQQLRDNANDQAANRVVLQAISDAIIAGATAGF